MSGELLRVKLNPDPLLQRRWRFCFVPVKEEQTLAGDENADEALERTGQVERVLSLEPRRTADFQRCDLELIWLPLGTLLCGVVGRGEKAVAETAHT